MDENTFQPEQPDDAFDRVRAADPAAGVEPNRMTLDAAVKARLADPVDELAAARARRGRSRWMAVAAVAAGALVFGSAGYAVGNRSASPTAAGAAIVLGGQGTQQGATQQGAGGPGTALQGSELGPSTGVKGPNAPAQANATDRMSSAMIAPWYGGRTVFTASGLSDKAGSAQAWAYDPGRVFSADTANRLAKVLGVKATASVVDGAWTVGPVDGSGPQLQLQPDGLASFNYYNPALDVSNCPTATPEGKAAPSTPQSSGGSVSSGSTGSGGVNPGGVMVPVPAPACTTTPADPAPQGAAAVAKARELLRALGLDADAYEYEAQGTGTIQKASVTRQFSSVGAYQVVGGERTGVTWSLSFVGASLQSLYGALAPVHSLGSYDVVSPTDAVSRLMDPRFGPSYSGGPIMYASAKGAVANDKPTVTEQNTTGATPDVGQVPPRTVPPTVRAGSAFGWPVTKVTLTKARLGLAQYTLPDGATVLLPAYALSGAADGQTWSVVAVTDAHLDFTTAK